MFSITELLLLSSHNISFIGSPVRSNWTFSSPFYSLSRKHNSLPDMILSSALSQIICFILCIRFSNGNSASDVDISATFPEGWCNKLYGTPTRTTGECICKTLCEGAGCVNQHGLSFYSYKKCPTCKCLPPSCRMKSAGAENLKFANDIDSQFEDEEETFATRSTRIKSGRANYQKDSPDLNSNSITIAEWFEDNGRLLFAGGVCFVLISFFVMLLSIK